MPCWVQCIDRSPNNWTEITLFSFVRDTIFLHVFSSSPTKSIDPTILRHCWGHLERSILPLLYWNAYYRPRYDKRLNWVLRLTLAAASLDSPLLYIIVYHLSWFMFFGYSISHLRFTLSAFSSSDNVLSRYQSSFDLSLHYPNCSSIESVSQINIKHRSYYGHQIIITPWFQLSGNHNNISLLQQTQSESDIGTPSSSSSKNLGCIDTTPVAFSKERSMRSCRC